MEINGDRDKVCQIISVKGVQSMLRMCIHTHTHTHKLSNDSERSVKRKTKQEEIIKTILEISLHVKGINDN